MSVYVKRKDRHPGEVTHKRNTDHFGMGLNALCGARGEKVRMSTNTRYVNCPACVEIIGQRQSAARERAAL